jgi:hypothetical protein
MITAMFRILIYRLIQWGHQNNNNESARTWRGNNIQSFKRQGIEDPLWTLGHLYWRYSHFNIGCLRAKEASGLTRSGLPRVGLWRRWVTWSDRPYSKWRSVHQRMTFSPGIAHATLPPSYYRVNLEWIPKTNSVRLLLLVWEPPISQCYIFMV